VEYNEDRGLRTLIEDRCIDLDSCEKQNPVASS
jgi:hypothetical protein